MIERISADNFGRVLTWVLLLGILVLLYRVVAPFLAPLAWAAILTTFLFPLHRRVKEKIPRENLAALVSVTVVTVLLVLPFAWLVPTFARQAVNLGRNLDVEQLTAQVRGYVEQNASRLPIEVDRVEQMAAEGLQSAQMLLAKESAKVAGGVAATLFDLFVMLLAMFYLFRDGEGLVKLLREVSPLHGDQHDHMAHSVANMIQVTLSSGFVVAITQGTLGGLLFWAVGIPGPIFWGVVMTVLAFLPIVGTGLVWAPAGVYMLVTGEITRGIVILAFGVLVVGLVDNILRPILISDRAQMNGLLVFVALLGGVQVFGFLGLVLGPLLVATAVGLLYGYRDTLVEQRAEQNVVVLSSPPGDAEVG